MPKGYIQGSKPQNKSLLIDYWFGSNPQKAAVWMTREEADIDCGIFDRHKIQIPTIWGGIHTCSGFKSEERKPGEFIVFCEAPFIPKQPSAQ
jgi:hypothetical protein